MSVWVTVDADYVHAAMPYGMSSSYDARIYSDAEKALRLAAITAGVVAEFREALVLEGVEVMDADTSKLPIRCALHAAVLSWFAMAVEIGFALTDPAVSEIRIDVAGAATDSDPRYAVAMARQFLQSLKAGKGPAGTPRYKSRADRLAERAAAGTSER